MKRPNIECLAKKFTENSVIMIIPAILVTSLIGAILALPLSGYEAFHFIGIFTTVGFILYLYLCKYAMKIKRGTRVVSEVCGDEFVERYNNYPRCGEYILTRFSQLYSPKGEDGLRLVIDMPRYNWYINYDFPYNWDEESSRIVETFKSRGIEVHNMQEIVGHPVLVKIKDGTTCNYKYYETDHPSDKIQRLYDDGEIMEDNVDSKMIEQNFDVSLPWNTREERIDEDLIESESSVYDFVDSVR
jgi:hypothetical protein